MIYSDDAPSLERELHKIFNEKRVNKVNLRKEFFNVTLEEIRDKVLEKTDKNIEFKITNIAKDYYESLKIVS